MTKKKELKKMDIKRVSIRVEEDLHKSLKHIAVEDNTTLQDMFIKAVEEKYSNRILEKRMKGEE